MPPTIPIGWGRIIEVYPSMYSPADLPSRFRAAPAKNRRLSAENGISSRETISGLPTLLASIWPGSWALSSRICASLKSSSERSFGVASSHSGSAFFARSTTASTSSAVMFGTESIFSAVAGLITSSVAMASLLFGAQDPALAGQTLCERDGNDRHSEDKEHDDVDLGELLPEADLAEDPDRQRFVRARRERRDDHLVEREREREQGARDHCRRDRREGDVAEGLKAVGAEVHRRFGERAGHAAQPGDHVVVDHDDAEGRVADDDRPEPEVDLPEREVRVEGHPGDDPRQRDRQHEEERDSLASEESETVHPERRGGAERDCYQCREGRCFQRQPQRLLHVGVVDRRREPLRRQPGDRAALDVRTGERVEAG